MNTANNKNTPIDDAFEVLETIKAVQVSPFFKDKTMQRLFSEKEEVVSTGFGWFTPKLQFATLICILVINSIGFWQLSTTEYNTHISEFASAYELSQEEQASLFD
ncbi:hypothetical protein [Kordia jejudonensis]|uniref:hypothetical protein n=1 Tax=Kordia jejudonensis TaxID=1348245 RepID=UPI0006292023|nr:hypothetical protein [Kordia jejudonensis]